MKHVFGYVCNTWSDYHKLVNEWADLAYYPVKCSSVAEAEERMAELHHVMQQWESQHVAYAQK